jgi:hypothetical protein
MRKLILILFPLHSHSHSTCPPRPFPHEPVGQWRSVLTCPSLALSSSFSKDGSSLVWSKESPSPKQLCLVISKSRRKAVPSSASEFIGKDFPLRAMMFDDGQTTPPLRPTSLSFLSCLTSPALRPLRAHARVITELQYCIVISRIEYDCQTPILQLLCSRIRPPSA